MNQLRGWRLLPVVVVSAVLAVACSSSDSDGRADSSLAREAAAEFAADPCAWPPTGGGSVVDQVSVALACEGDVVRDGMAETMEASADEALASGFAGFDEAAMEAVVVCMRREIAAVTDDELLGLAAASTSFDFFDASIGGLIGERCQGSFVGLGGISGRELIDEVVALVDGADAWTVEGPIDIDGTAGWSAVRDGFLLFSAFDAATEEALTATLVFEPELADGELGVAILVRLLEVVGVDLPSEALAPVLAGATSPGAPPFQLCTSANDGVVIVVVQPGPSPCSG